MANQILMLAEVEDLFWKLTTKMLGYDTTDPLNADKVRIAWPTTGAPTFKISEDVAFLRVNNPDDPIIRQRDVGYVNIDQNTAARKVSYTRVHTVKWIFYGPASYDNAETVRNGIYVPKFKEIYNAKNMYLILDVIAPARFPELFNGQWWQRTDFEASFNELIIRDSDTVNYIVSSDIQIKESR